MPAQDQLEIIDPQGRIRFYALDLAKGITNIGRHIDNDIIINRPGVAAFHAMIDHRRQPYHLVVLAQREKTGLDGEAAPVNVPIPLTSWASLEIGGHQIIYLAGDAPAETPAGPASAPESAPEAPTPDKPPDVPEAAQATPPPDPTAALSLEASARALAVDPGQSATLDLTLVNGGYKSVTFDIAFSGLDPMWFKVTPEQVEVPARQRATVSVLISPPRQSAAHAVSYTAVATVTSPAFAKWKLEHRLTMTVNAFADFAVSDLTPRAQSLSPGKAFAQASFEITNRGNALTAFRLTAEDERYACRYEFKVPDDPLYQPKQAELRLGPGESGAVQVRVTPTTRRRVGWGARAHYYTVTVAPQGSAPLPRSVLGEVREQPVIGPVLIVAALALLLALLAAACRPSINAFTVEPDQILAGEQVTLNWSASPFAWLRINPDVGRVAGPDGRLTLSPRRDTIYTLIAENTLTFIAPEWFRATREVTVLVDPVLPAILFTTDRDTVAAGESVTLAWQVSNAEELILEINGLPEAIPVGQFKSSRTVQPVQDTLYALRALNEFTTADGVVATIAVRVVPGTAAQATAAPTAPSAAVIDQFEISPAEITSGQQTTIYWSVSGVDKVFIDPLPGEFPPAGNIVVSPTETTAYTLTASGGETPVKLVKQVIVNPAPGAPRVQSFTAAPAEVLPGSPEARSVKLSWLVTGDTTDIQLSGPGLAPVAGLPAEGQLNVSVDSTSTYTLTAFNGPLTTTQSVQVRVSAPAPTLVSVGPASGTAGAGAFTLTVTGSNFINGSVVQWNGSPRSTTYVSASQLLAAITAADLASAGAATVTVLNPSPGGGTSGAVTFTINNPAPLISGLSPNSAVAGGSAFALTINGSGFNSQTIVRWNGSSRTVSNVSAAQLTVLISAADIAVPGNATVTVVNPAPGGGSDASVFTVNAPTATPTASPSATPTASPTPTPTATP